jgi:hypothetical protein
VEKVINANIHVAENIEMNNKLSICTSSQNIVVFDEDIVQTI